MVARLCSRLVLRALAGLALFAAPASATVTIDWVTVGDPGNAPDTASNCYEVDCGSVPHAYRISMYEVTNEQYAEFLNEKAASDPLGLYSTYMGNNAMGGITRIGSPGNHVYSVKPGFADRPVNLVSFYDALRFANWLHNGQGAGDTETGAYTLLGGTAIPSNGLTVTRNPGAIVFLPSENEWYKAAYYDGPTATYFDYPAGTDTTIVCSVPIGIANRANCNNVLDHLTDLGSYGGSASPSGTFDQGGNVWEWNEVISNISARGFRGGSWDLQRQQPRRVVPVQPDPGVRVHRRRLPPREPARTRHDRAGRGGAPGAHLEAEPAGRQRSIAGRPAPHRETMEPTTGFEPVTC